MTELVNKHRGRGRSPKAISADTINRALTAYVTDELTVKEIMKKYGISQYMLYKLLREKGVK